MTVFIAVHPLEQTGLSVCKGRSCNKYAKESDEIGRGGGWQARDLAEFVCFIDFFFFA